jgi:hypothetical protein
MISLAPTFYGPEISLKIATALDGNSLTLGIRFIISGGEKALSC